MSTRHAQNFYQSHSQTPVIRSPIDETRYRSADSRVPGRAVPSIHPVERPQADSQIRYSIAYVPGMSQHV